MRAKVAHMSRYHVMSPIEDPRLMSFGYDSMVIHSDTAEVTQGSLANVARSLCGLLSGALIKREM